MTDSSSPKTISGGVLAIAAAIGAGIVITVAGWAVQGSDNKPPKQAQAAQRPHQGATVTPATPSAVITHDLMPAELPDRIETPPAPMQMRPPTRGELYGLIGRTIGEVNSATVIRLDPKAYDANRLLRKNYTGSAHAHKDAQKAWKLHFSGGILRKVTEVDLVKLVPGMFDREEE